MRPIKCLVSAIFLVAVSPTFLAAQQAPSVIVGVVSERDVTPQFQYVGRPGVTDVISVSGFSLIAGGASNVALVIAILEPEARTTHELAWYGILGRKR